MTDKNANTYYCQNCQTQFSKWAGRCLACDTWGSLKKITANADTTTTAMASLLNLDNFQEQRLTTGLPEIDRVLGGGLVSGSLILLGGEPGIGKSTLVLQLADHILDTLYCSAEESQTQVSLRAQRLNCKAKINVTCENNLEKIIALIKKDQPKLAVIDSIQTILSSELGSEAGSLTQVRYCGQKLLELAKTDNISLLLIGHVTKDGSVAGPKTLEHLVDTVLYLENDRQGQYRLLRSSKNRFGSTNELGIFEMSKQGLLPITNPAAAFLQGIDQNIPGSIVTVINEGARSFLIEVQSITNKTVYGLPQRKTSGYDLSRLQLLLAVLEKRLNLKFSQQDVYLNIIGGLKVKEVDVDLAICLSLISAYKDKVLSTEAVALGEVGLGGEVRPIKFLKQRIAEAANLGFKKIYLPAASNMTHEKIKLIPVKNLQDLIK